MSTTPEQCAPLVAWEVNIDSMRCFVFAATKPKAQWIATKEYWDAGYGIGRWPRASARRSPRHDESPRKMDGPKAWAEDSL